MKNEKPVSYRFHHTSPLEERIRDSLCQIPSAAADAHLHATILFAQEELRLKQGRERISFLRFLAKQIGFTGRKIWAAQGFSLFIISILLSRFFELPFTSRQLIRLLACLSILLFMTALPLLYRSVRYRMQEVEAAARFCGVKLLFSRLIIIGIGDVCLLAGLFLTVLLKTALPKDSAFFCLCFPFLLAGGGCLYLLGHCPPGRFFAGSLLYCLALLLVFSILPGQGAFWYQPSLSAAQALLCALLFAFCIRQLRYLSKVSSYEEMQLS